MLEEIDIRDVLFLDIETVPGYKNYNDLDEKSQVLWDKKSKSLSKGETTAEELYQRAGIYSEFGKVVCISVGFAHKQDEEYHFRLKSFYSEIERDLLCGFRDLLNSMEHKNIYLCAHNGKEFDFPYIARRMLVNGIKLPQALNMAGKKPWEIKHIDTMELWRFGDYKHYTSLELLTHIFNIPSPKADIDGSMVGKVFYEDRDLERIQLYCQNDVIAIAQLFLRYRNEELIKEEHIHQVL